MLVHNQPLMNRRRAYVGLAAVLLAVWILPQSLNKLLSPSTQTVGTRARITSDLSKLALPFEANAGQTDPAVLFTARAGASTFYFTCSQVVMSMAAPRPSAVPNPGGASQLHEMEAQAGAPSIVRLNFVGANPEPKVLPGVRLPGTVSYFLGSNSGRWRTGLPTYGNITYSDLYPGIDLRYEGTQSSLKGTYVVSPGADPTRIRWRYTGADAVSIDAAGNLQIKVRGSKADAQLVEQAPVAWQEINGKRVPVRLSYATGTGGSVGFAPGRYDPAYELIIDPTLVYSTFLGGSSVDYGYAIAVDSQGNAYVTGATGSTDFPQVHSIYPPSPGGDLFVTKISPDARTILYSTLIGGSDSDVGWGIAVDSSGSAYVTGETWSFDFPLVNPFQPYHMGVQSDALLLKLNPAGTALVYSTYLGGAAQDVARDIAIDGDGNAYVTGYTLSSNFPLANPFQSTIHGIQDGFVTKMNSTGSALVFSTFLGGSSNIEYSNSLAVDSQRAVYVAGYTESTDFPLQNPIQPTNHGFADTFITKFNPSGTSLAYSTYLGGGDNDIQYSGLAVDSSGSAYVTGYTDSTDFPVANAYQGTKNGFEDVFVTKINPAGTAWAYSTYLGGIFPDGNYRTKVAVDSGGNAYVAGNTRSSDFPLVNNVQTGNIDSSYDDVFVTKFDSSGQNLVYSTRLGGNNGSAYNNLDYVYGLTLDAGGNVYVTGQTNSPQYPSTSGVFQPALAGNYDAFIAKFSAQGPNTPTPTPTGTPPTATPTPCNPDANYSVSQQTGVSIVPGTQDIGNHCDECVTRLALPFPVRVYDRIFTSALVGSHGTVGFIANQNFGTNQCLPATNPLMFNYAILPFWSDVRTDGYGITCPNGCGIFTSVTGSAPNRVLHMEWRGSVFSSGSYGYVNFELRLFEGSPNIEVVYGQLFAGSGSATIGLQKDTGSQYMQYACNSGSVTPGTALTFSLPDCGTQATPTLTPTFTPTFTPTATPTPSRRLVGHVTWQGPPSQPNTRQQLPITLTLQLGGTRIDYPAQNTDASGFFTESVSGLVAGTYNWRVKGPKYLSNSGTVTLNGAPSTSAEMGLMRAGDCNNDNTVNLSDYIILRATFGKAVGDPGYDDRADFTGDERVDVADYLLLKNNYGLVGAAAK